MARAFNRRVKKIIIPLDGVELWQQDCVLDWSHAGVQEDRGWSLRRRTPVAIIDFQTE